MVPSEHVYDDGENSNASGGLWAVLVCPNGKDMVRLGFRVAVYLIYSGRLRLAAKGFNGSRGGLNKGTVGQVMRWAAKNGWVPHKSVWKGKNRLVMTSSGQLRRSLKRNFGKIQREMIAEIPDHLKNPSVTPVDE